MLDRARPFSPLVIRAFLATFLIYMTQDNVFSAARMQEFVEFMTAEGFPAAAVLAPISVYAQFACGLLVAFGLLTRWAAAIMTLTSSLPSSACTSELRFAHSLTAGHAVSVDVPPVTRPGTACFGQSAWCAR